MRCLSRWGVQLTTHGANRTTDLFSWAWLPPNFNEVVDQLAKLAMNENWDSRLSPTGENPLVRRYLKRSGFGEEHRCALWANHPVTPFEASLLAGQGTSVRSRRRCRPSPGRPDAQRTALCSRSRSSIRRILPVRVFGRSSTNSIRRGYA